MLQLKNWSKGLSRQYYNRGSRSSQNAYEKVLDLKEIQIKAAMRNNFFPTFPIGKYPNKGVVKWSPSCPVDGTKRVYRDTFLEGNLDALGKP